ncbi:MAG: diguanylate cyclase [Lysobacterales bacterium]|nr:MAG: diguanylate cyclase [Xanthomonadales bacterium]
MFKAEPRELLAMLRQLEQASREHGRWHDALVRTLVCRLAPEPTDLAPDGHGRCRFGHWLEERAPAALREQIAYPTIEREHVRLHQVAMRLLQLCAGGAAISTRDYDELAASGHRLRAALDALRHEIQGALRSTDALTGAYGRVEMLPELQEWCELARRGLQHCCLAFMDVDRFKAINDTHGHAIGDEVLSAAVRYLVEHLRPYDKVFRYGGDEFLVSLPGVDLAAGERVLDRIRRGLEGLPLATAADGSPVQATVSFGLAMLDPDAGVAESIDRADKALLVAKAAGRNRIVCWDPAVTTATLPGRAPTGAGRT